MLRVKKKLFDGYDGLAYIIDEAINDGSILSQSLKEGDEKLGNSNFFTLILLLSFFFGSSSVAKSFLDQLAVRAFTNFAADFSCGLLSRETKKIK